MGFRENTGIISERKPKTGNNQDIDFGVAEYPEKMHPNRRRAAGLSVEEMPTEIAVDQQHDLRSGSAGVMASSTIPLMTKLSRI